jgi:ElaB/YqjD/DUF883 family membrane-anchored ribosome-binding protein
MTTKPHIHKEDIEAELQDDLEVAARKAGRRARKIVEDNSFILEGTDGLVTAISEKPIQSMLIALGVGLVIGKIFSR